MNKDIFTIQPLSPGSVEHVIPSAFGGRLTSKELILQSTNNRFGSTIEPVLIKDFRFVLNGLEMLSRRGKVGGYELSSGSNPGWELVSGFRPVLEKGSIETTESEGRIAVNITARSRDQAIQLLEGMSKKYGRPVEQLNPKMTVRREYIKQPFLLSSSLGGALQMRAIAKMAIELAALNLGNDAACSAPFDDIRRWLMDGVDNCDSYTCGKQRDSQFYVHHDYREGIWDGLPSLTDSPFQHRLFVFSGQPGLGTWGCLELFGHIRFSIMLSTSDKLERKAFGYMVDPVTGAEERRPTLSPRSSIDFAISESVLPVAEAKEAISALMEAIQRRVRDSFYKTAIDECRRSTIPPDCEILTEDLIALFADCLARKIVGAKFGITEEREMTLDELRASPNDLSG